VNTHRRQVRPRYGRIAALTTSLVISGVTALAGLGVLTTSTAQAGAAAKQASYTQDATDASGSLSGRSTADAGTDAGTGTDTGQVAPPADPGETTGGADNTGDTGVTGDTDTSSPTDVPADSGTGRRIVFSQQLQRVWLLGQKADDVRRTYLVSGSVTHNLQPGTYSVYSRSRWAVGVEDSGVMQYFVRFTEGPTGAAIGFHSIPTKNGVPLQSKKQLGTPESHGCIRQDLPDAIALWNFAPVGTKVVVVA
jgi:lipoprotein-anchoring transpeptidase ErfK/SrfK